ncbi:MAG TPA: thiamine-phosphate kinase [Gemmatimonadaceae bacterium]|nr:thiamine-phosphate kinase [Gemmatimonadaceae bacterium]
MTREITMGPGREFELIRDMLFRWGDRAFGVGDDAATLEGFRGGRLVLSTDSSVEHVHFRRAWMDAREIGYRATAAALSDLAAMAASPVGVLVAMSVPEDWLPELGDVADGIGEAVGDVGARILGGDMTAGRDLALTITVLGHSAEPLSRAGARAGDAIYVTGRFGGPAAALKALREGERPDPVSRFRFAHPVPRIREAQWLAEHGAHAAIDVSDGLLADTLHMAYASNVRVTLDLDELPTLGGMPPADAARSGEEYELIVSAPHGLDTEAFEEELGTPLSQVGRVEAGKAGVVATQAGERVSSFGGYSHF